MLSNDLFDSVSIKLGIKGVISRKNQKGKMVIVYIDCIMLKVSVLEAASYM